MTKDVPTYVLCASHIGCEPRIESLIEALESIRVQTKPPAAVYLSISYSQEVKLDHTFDRLQKALGPVPLRFYEQVGKWQQFDHYKFLVDQLEETDYIMFIDDDDKYAENKIENCERYSVNKTIMVQHYLAKWYTPENLVSNNISNTEYVCLSMPAKVLCDFFRLKPLIWAYTDLDFAEYCHSKCELSCLYFDFILYYHRVDFRFTKDYDNMMRTPSISSAFSTDLQVYQA
jgi:hypothetical protein